MGVLIVTILGIVTILEFTKLYEEGKKAGLVKK